MKTLCVSIILNSGFMISEEDKTSRTSIEYWFKVIDINSDGYITPDEMKYFYDEQISRFEYSDHTATPFKDLLCQLSDMIKPEEGYKFSLNNILNVPHYASLFFNSLVNLTKFISFDERDPFLYKSENEKYAGYSDWDKFASNEYQRLALDDGDEEVQATENVFGELNDF